MLLSYLLQYEPKSATLNLLNIKRAVRQLTSMSLLSLNAEMLPLSEPRK